MGLGRARRRGRGGGWCGWRRGRRRRCCRAGASGGAARRRRTRGRCPWRTRADRVRVRLCPITEEMSVRWRPCGATAVGRRNPVGRARQWRKSSPPGGRATPVTSKLRAKMPDASLATTRTCGGGEGREGWRWGNRFGIPEAWGAMQRVGGGQQGGCGDVVSAGSGGRRGLALKRRAWPAGFRWKRNFWVGSAEVAVEGRGDVMEAVTAMRRATPPRARACGCGGGRSSEQSSLFS